MYVRWEYAHEVTLSGGGGGEHVRWEYACKVDATWLWAVEVEGSTQGENMYVRWEYACEVTLSGGGGGEHVRWEYAHEVDARWLWVVEVEGNMRGENMYMRWEYAHEVTFWHFVYEPPSEIFHPLIFFTLITKKNLPICCLSFVT